MHSYTSPRNIKYFIITFNIMSVVDAMAFFSGGHACELHKDLFLVSCRLVSFNIPF